MPVHVHLFYLGHLVWPITSHHICRNRRYRGWHHCGRWFDLAIYR